MTDPQPPRAIATSIVDVRIRHDERTVWTPDGVSFEIADGEVVLLLGPSGSGKSTLALAVNGLIPHAVPAELAGTVTTGGLDTAGTPVATLSEHVSMVFQDPDSQIVTGTLLDEVCFGPENQLLPVDEVLARAERALRQVGLWERRTENPDRLSGGGRQRLAIACALAMGSRLFVLDEPTANLDPAGIDEVYAVLGDLVRERRHAILLVEHNLDAAIDLVDRVVVLDRSGRLVFDGPTREVLLGHLDDLLAMGVWVPVATLAGLRLRDAGIALDPLPLTPAELTAALNAQPSLPQPTLPVPVPVPEPVEGPTPTTPPPVPEPVEGPSPVPTQTPVPELVEGPTPTPAVSVRNLSVTRGRREILHDVSLDIARGDFVAVIGTNGAGKTTLVQAIAGVVAPPRGRISVGDLDPGRSDVRALAGAIGFVFQNPEHQFITHTVHHELAHGLRIRGVDEAEVERRVDAMLTRFGLESLRDVHPFLLSGGQKRRLSVGTALIAGAPVLALDEPTFGQDRERAVELLALLAELNRQGTTVIVVTHDMQLVADDASHVAVLDDGRLLAYGRTADILADDELIARAGLRLPPLARAMRGVTDPRWRAVSRLQDLPSAPAPVGPHPVPEPVAAPPVPEPVEGPSVPEPVEGPSVPEPVEGPDPASPGPA
ncbi:ABC transporter ATP-binding protein [Plantibacter sp. Mn2098]|uniref:ABC transporter ATP-binding protein n=1 Tax=Plantibacter sp. Mn2098 TaxID=3395266 RepID=UPI003BC29816